MVFDQVIQSASRDQMGPLSLACHELLMNLRRGYKIFHFGVFVRARIYVFNK